MSLKQRPVTTVTIDGRATTTDQVSVSSDSPLDLHLPPSVGNLAGAAADVDLSLNGPITHRPEAPWSPSFRARPGSPATVDIDGVRVFTGIVDDADVSLDAGTVNASLLDVLSGYDVRFDAPAALNVLPPLPGSSQERPVGASMLMQVCMALEALGAHPTTPITDRTDLHVSMAGTTAPQIGTAVQVTQRDIGEGGGPITPHVAPLVRPMSGGRIGVLNPWLEYHSRTPAATAPTVGSWHLTVEVDPPQSNGAMYVYARGMTTDDAWGFRIVPGGGAMVVMTWDAAGVTTDATYDDQGMTLTEYPLHSSVERIIVVYNVVDQYFEVRLHRADGVVDEFAQRFDTTTPPPSITPTARQLRVRVTGQGVIGAVSLMSRASWIGANNNPFIGRPRGVHFDMSYQRLMRWSMIGHPPVINEPAVAWLMRAVAEHRAFIHSDEYGVIHIADPADWVNLPVSHTVTDGVVDGDVELDDVQVSVARRRRYSRVRVIGQRVIRDTGWGPGMKPNRLYAGADKEIVLRAGDAPVELWLEPEDRDGFFWVEPADLAIRYAGEPATESWHKVDDFARGRGTWGGGHVRDAETGEIIRWALSTEWGAIVTNPRPADVLYAAEQVSADRIKVTITPGPGLDPGQEYVNLPDPTSVGLREQNPAKLSQFLPVFRGPSVGRISETEGVSADIAPDPDGWGDLTEYVHDARLGVQSVTQAEELAQILADSHQDDFGLVVVHADLDPAVKIGQRVHIEPRSRSDATLDGVVVGIPSRDVGSMRMTLKVWVLEVIVHSITYADRDALRRAADLAEGGGGSDTYATDRARLGGTYDAEQDAALAAANGRAHSLTQGSQ